MAKDDTSKTSIAVRGRLRIVEYAVCKEGVYLPKTSLTASNKRDQAWLLARFQILAEQGERGISNEDVFRKERNIPEDIKGTGRMALGIQEKDAEAAGGWQGTNPNAVLYGWGTMDSDARILEATPSKVARAGVYQGFCDHS